MKSEIFQFCTTCSQSLGSLPEAIRAAATQFERGGEALQSSLITLNDLRARLRSLTDKLESQNAYLLIFGPLKSGKSTLMNALSGAYVSEVTSLPGYPCLVFVQHSETPHHSVTRYNGRETVLGSGMELKAVVEDAHPVLAAQIRAAEEAGIAFDPAVNFPETIRRVDIKVPVPPLDESAMILVDTPGLYSRMNFGYDVLTREFRDGAACAVFVVKTDNLFLDQVFAEFNQLLGIFSRIFIVVNVDTGKRDLAPDGSLCPSAESEHPERVLEAFRTLSMAGPLRAAYDAGRVRIHAVDLMSAASAILSKPPEKRKALPAFDAFEDDLIEYLNSSDYTREFIRDSLRQGQTLCTEMQAVVANEEVTALRKKQDALGAEILALNARIAATDQLLQADWNALRLAGTMHAGLHLSQAMISDLITSDYSLRANGERAFAAARADDDLPGYKMSVAMETIPVRKSFADWLLFRGRAKVRQRLFGADGNRAIAPLEKERRLPVNSRAEFERQWEDTIRERFPARPGAFAAKLAESYVTAAADNIRSGLRTLRSTLAAERDARQAPFDMQAAILRSADDLQNQAMRVSRDLDLLSEKENANLAHPPPIPSACATAPDAGLIPSPAIPMLPLLGP